MKKNTIPYLFLFFVLQGFSQQTGIKLLEYNPAPGQHINIENIGTPAAAQKITQNIGSLVSLGSFGGYVVLGFEKACINHPDHPYGIDFTIFGNSFSGSSEPGVIWIMQDENRNGLPDDTWYEIAGSSHFHSKTVRNYQVTYFKTDNRDVYWKDNYGENGWLRANDYNLQEYYPSEEYFPGYPRDSVVFRGTLLTPAIDFSNAQEIKIMPQAFGYADNRSRKQGVDLSLPDNPYTSEVEGAGGDPIDISWAIDHLGNYMEPDSIHFVKVVSGNLTGAGWLGEISTDVAWVEPVRPNPEISGKENMLVVYPYPVRVLAGDSVRIEAGYFRKGRKEPAGISFFSQDEHVARVKPTGWLKTENPGSAELLIAAGDETDTARIKVVTPDSLQLSADISSVYPGDSVELAAQVYDNELFTLDVPVQFSSSDTLIGKIVSGNGRFFFAAVRPGETVLTLSVKGFPVEMEVPVKVLSPGDQIRIFFTLEAGQENVLPFQWIDVGPADLNSMVENRQHDYSGVDRPVLLHAMAAGLKKAAIPFQFMDDDASGGKIYLYSLENEGLFWYGWGGKTSPAAFARAWIARLNNKSFLNQFDQIEISDSDTLALYHVNDITNPWHYSRLSSSRNSAGTGDEIEVWLEQTVCTYSEDGISESGFVPLANTEILAGQSYFTGSDGKTVFTLTVEPPLTVSSGSNAVLISKKTLTGAYSVSHHAFEIYPNPFINEFFIGGIPAVGYPFSRDFSMDDFIDTDHFSGVKNGPFPGAALKMISSDGRLIYDEILSFIPARLNSAFLPSGVYYLVILYQDRTETHKIIKK
jgi:hypothetical protein